MAHMDLANMMAPRENKGTYTDEYGYTWDYVTKTGLRRRKDRFFIPHLMVYNHTNHSVEAQEIIRMRINEEKNATETTVTVSSFDGWVVYSCSCI